MICLMKHEALRIYNEAFARESVFVRAPTVGAVGEEKRGEKTQFTGCK